MAKRALVVLSSFGIFLLFPLTAAILAEAGPFSQDQVLSLNTAESFEISPMQEKIISLEIRGPGRLEASVVWTGSGTLNMILTGPGQDAPYARRYGPAPLDMTFFVSAELAALGEGWKITIRNPMNQGIARGEIRYAFRPEKGEALQRSAGGTLKGGTPPGPLTQLQSSGPASSRAVTRSGKSVAVRKFEIKDQANLNAAEIAEVKAQIEIQKRQVFRSRVERGLDRLFSESNLAPLILPLAVRKLDEMSRENTVYSGIDVGPYLRDLSSSIKDINLQKGQRYFRSNLLSLDLKVRANRTDLGRAIILAVEPDFDQKIRDAVRVSLGDRNPRFQWRSTRARPAAVLRSGAGAGVRAELAAQVGEAAAQLSQTSSPLARTKALERLQGLLDTGRFKAQGDLGDVSVQRGINPKDMRPYVPDLSSTHDNVNYLNYRVELERFTCIHKNEYSNDEAYFITQRVLPRFDPRALEYSGELGKGRLYNVLTRATRVYGGIGTGETVAIVPGEGLLFEQQLYAADAFFSIDLYESDYSTSQVLNAYQDAAANLARYLQEEIKALVIDAIKDSVLAGLREALPAPAVVLIDAIISGNFDESTIQRLQDIVGGLQTDIIILAMLFSGKSFGEILNFISGGCPELYLVITAIEVCGPILIDFLQGDWREAFRAILFLPSTVFRSFIGIFEDLYNFIMSLMAAIDPDDHIQTRKVSISAAPAPLGGDADWDQRNAPGGAGGRHEGRPPQHMRSALSTIHPELWFFGSSAFYKLFYKVTRVLYGGKEVFGFTLDPERGIYTVQRFYQVKSPYRDKIRVKISTMDTLDVPIVCVTGAGGSNLNAGGEREFLVDGFPDRQYTVTIGTLHGRPMWGFVSLEENSDPQPYTGPPGSGGGGSSGGGGIRDGQREQIK